MGNEQSIPFLQVRHLSASFAGPQGELNALSDVTFNVGRGEFVCLIGPSGCGKSTLLRILAGLLSPTAGHVTIEGDEQQRPGRRVGLIFQDPTLLPWRTVYDNVALPLELMGWGADRVDRHTKSLLAFVGLAEFASAYPATLSGGMAQRTALARALAQEPDVLLLDEPFGALDALTREYMSVELLRIWERTHRTMVMVTHNVEEAALLADRVVVLSARPGRIVEVVPVPLPRPRSPEMLTSSELQEVAQHLRDVLCMGNQQEVFCPLPVESTPISKRDNRRSEGKRRPKHQSSLRGAPPSD
jgi:NitT/TauT family transport system ATP-binding protein